MTYGSDLKRTLEWGGLTKDSFPEPCPWFNPSSAKRTPGRK